MYPVILNPSGRMGFGRVAKTRISYVRSAVSSAIPQDLAGMKYQMLVEFPDKDLETANLHITLSPQYAQSTTAVKLLVRFDGIGAVLVDYDIAGNGLFSDHVPGSGLRTLSPHEVAASFASREPFRQLMQSAFGSFKYRRLGIGDRNADKFFPAGRLRVAPIEYYEQPVVVVSEPT